MCRTGWVPATADTAADTRRSAEKADGESKFAVESSRECAGMTICGLPDPTVVTRGA